MSDEDDLDGTFIARRALDDEFTIGETYASRQEAINAFGDDYGEPDGTPFQTGVLRHKREHPPLPIGADTMIDTMIEHAYHDWTSRVLEDVEELANRHRDELQQKLAQVWNQWCEKHNIAFEGYSADDIEDHVVGTDEDDDVIEARRKLEDDEMDAAMEGVEG